MPIASVNLANRELSSSNFWRRGDKALHSMTQLCSTVTILGEETSPHQSDTSTIFQILPSSPVGVKFPVIA
jgi:hypothetical protein